MAAEMYQEIDDESGTLDIFVTPKEQESMAFEKFVECYCAFCRGRVMEVPLSGCQTADLHLGQLRVRSPSEITLGDRQQSLIEKRPIFHVSAFEFSTSIISLESIVSPASINRIPCPYRSGPDPCRVRRQQQ